MVFRFQNIFFCCCFTKRGGTTSLNCSFNNNANSPINIKRIYTKLKSKLNLIDLLLYIYPKSKQHYYSNQYKMVEYCVTKQVQVLPTIIVSKNKKLQKISKCFFF